MASSLPDSSTCCPVTCDNEVAVAVPGPAGAAGSNGTNGTNGVSAFTTTGAAFNMPAEGADTASLLVGSSAWMGVGQKVWMTNAGTMQVISKADATHVVLRNLEDTASGLYTDNVAPATVVALGQTISPAGLQGPAGVAAGGSFVIANNLNEGVAATMRGNIGLGSVNNTSDATKPVSTAQAAAIAVAQAAAIAASQPLDTDLTAIAALVSAADRVPYSTGAGTWALSVLTAAGRALLDDADAAAQRATLGIGRTLQDILIYQHQLAAGTDAGDFASGAWQTVPINTEVTDVGAHGSIAANTITLATGVYRVRWRSCGYLVDRFQSRLFNVTTAAVVGLGTTVLATVGASGFEVSHGEARITITAATEDIRIQAQCETTNAVDGFGIANAFGGTQVYAAITLEREVG